MNRMVRISSSALRLNFSRPCLVVPEPTVVCQCRKLIQSYSDSNWWPDYTSADKFKCYLPKNLVKGRKLRSNSKSCKTGALTSIVNKYLRTFESQFDGTVFKYHCKNRNNKGCLHCFQFLPRNFTRLDKVFLLSPRPPACTWQWMYVNTRLFRRYCCCHFLAFFTYRCHTTSSTATPNSCDSRLQMLVGTW